jgi:AraC family transcriptional regulator of adaptative response / DNA-3-methyladenine glycosylase II
MSARLATCVAEARNAPDRFDGPRALAAAAGARVRDLDVYLAHMFHTTPAAFLESARVDAARRVLDRDRARTEDAARAAGFATVLDMDAAFVRHTGLRPADYRRLGRADRFTLVLPAGYRHEPTLTLAGRDSASPAERAGAHGFTKAMQGPAGPMRCDVRFARGRARCIVSLPASRPVPREAVLHAHAAVCRMLGLHLDPAPFERRAARDRVLGPLLRGRTGLRIPLTAEPFEAVVWAIAGQQVNLSFATTLRRDLIALAGAPAGEGARAHPTAAAVARLDYADLTRIRFSRRKAEYLVDTARAVADGRLPIDVLANGPAPDAEAALLATRGFGRWSTHYVMLRGFGFADCVPAGDSGLSTALERFFQLDGRPDADATVALMARFAPYRSLATYLLWSSLGDPP